MTAYSGNKIKLAPDAAVFDVSVTRSQSGTQGVYKIALGGTWVSSDKVTIDGTEVTFSSTSASTNASAIATAMSGNTNYTVTASSSNVTFTEKAGHYGIGAPSYSTTSTAGTLTPSTTTQGVSTEAVVKSPTTYVDRLGVLHAGDDLEAGDSITVKATCTYINPSGDTSALEDSITIAVA